MDFLNECIKGFLLLFCIYILFCPSACMADLPPLIPRDVLFGNPEKSNAMVSPDGNYISYLAPLNGVMNVWITKIGVK